MLNEVVLEALQRCSVMAESREWTKQDLDQVVDTLLEEKRNGRKILLAGVFGARLSEGVDYHSGALDAVACIGIPNPPPSVLSKSLKAYAENAWSQPCLAVHGFAAGGQRILQAMGRPIRSIGDRALIVLLDRRAPTVHTQVAFLRTYA